MFWKNWSWSIRILFGITCIFAACVILFPIFARAREPEGHRSCQSNLKQLGLGIIQYTMDYDEKFPPIITGSSAYGWADAIQPYLKSTHIYHCPSVPEEGQNKDNPLKDHYTDYPFNANLGHKSLMTIENTAWQIMSLDGNDGQEVTNARYCLTQIPPKWLQDEASPLYRHLKTANFLFADGHVKSLRPSQLSTDKHLVF